MKTYKAVDVFKPSDFPDLTYVDRAGEAKGDKRIEQRLRDALDTPGEVISVSGPSKAGKTVLVERVVGENLITVSGAGIKSASDLWDRALDWMDVPGSSSGTVTITGTGTLSGTLKATGGVPFVASGSAEAGASGSLARARAATQTRDRRGMVEVVKEIGGSDFVLLIDDFHYIDAGAQREVAEQIKAVAREKVKIICASVPHRADDVVRANHELRGRVQTVDMSYWSVEELVEIGHKGFPLLNVSMDLGSLQSLAKECSGSPQLMQAACLSVCFDQDFRETKDGEVECTLDAADLIRIFKETSSRFDFSKLIRTMHAGPRVRGVERKIHQFTDGSSGDVYRCLLLALKENPPALSTSYAQLVRRIQSVCVNDTPQMQSVQTACQQISSLALNLHPDQRIVEWDQDVLEIVDPYFLFFLRWSGRLAEMG